MRVDIFVDTIFQKLCAAIKSSYKNLDIVNCAISSAITKSEDGYCQAPTTKAICNEDAEDSYVSSKPTKRFT